MSSHQEQPAASLHTNPDHLAVGRAHYRDLYGAGVRRTVPQAIIHLNPETIPLNVDDVEYLAPESEELRDLLSEKVPQVLEVALNQQGTDRLHKNLRSRMPMPERAVWATAAMFVAVLAFPLALAVLIWELNWELLVLCLAAIGGGFMIRRMSINYAVAGVSVDGEQYPSEGLSGVTHPAFDGIMVKLAELARLQGIPVLEHPLLGDLQTVAIFVRDTRSGDLSRQEEAALHEEVAQLIDTFASRIDSEIADIHAIRENTQRELDALGACAAQELLTEGDEQINDIKVAGIRDRAEMLRKSIEKRGQF